MMGKLRTGPAFIYFAPFPKFTQGFPGKLGTVSHVRVFVLDPM